MGAHAPSKSASDQIYKSKKTCDPILIDLFLSSCEVEFMQMLLTTKRNNRSKAFNLTFRLIDDAMSVYNLNFVNGITCI